MAWHGNRRPRPLESDQRHGLLGYLGPDPVAEDIRIITVRQSTQPLYRGAGIDLIGFYCSKCITLPLHSIQSYLPQTPQALGIVKLMLTLLLLDLSFLHWNVVQYCCEETTIIIHWSKTLDIQLLGTPSSPSLNLTFKLTSHNPKYSTWVDGKVGLWSLCYTVIPQPHTHLTTVEPSIMIQVSDIGGSQYSFRCGTISAFLTVANITTLLPYMPQIHPHQILECDIWYLVCNAVTLWSYYIQLRWDNCVIIQNYPQNIFGHLQTYPIDLWCYLHQPTSHLHRVCMHACLTLECSDSDGPLIPCTHYNPCISHTRTGSKTSLRVHMPDPSLRPQPSLIGLCCRWLRHVYPWLLLLYFGCSFPWTLS